MNHLKSVFCILLGLLWLSGCSEKAPQQQGNASLSFTLPASLAAQAAQKVGAFSGTACFAVSISAGDIPTASPGSCDQAYGIVAGLSPLGQAVEMEAPFGKNRTIEIFYVISDQGCNAFDSSNGLGEVYGSNRVYRISRTTGIDFNQPVVTVNAVIEYPSTSNSMATLFSLPESCKQDPSPINVASIKQARVVQGSAHGVTELGSKMSVRIYDQKLNMKSPTDFSGRLTPVRLGEEQ